MSRSINNVVLTGNGILITFDDNANEQYIWTYTKGNLALTNGKDVIPYSLISEIISKVGVNSRSVGFWSHLFGTSGFHIRAAALSQVDTSLTQNSWTILMYDSIVLESQATAIGLRIDENGVIKLPYGEYYINATVLVHRSGSGGTDGVTLSIQGYDLDLNSEIPFSFNQGTTPALNNSPLALQTSFIVDHNNSTPETKSIVIRIQTDSNRCALGVNNGTLPLGSENHAGYINIFRIG